MTILIQINEQTLLKTEYSIKVTVQKKLDNR